MIALVSQQIGMKRLSREFIEPPLGKTRPTVLPHLLAIVVQVSLDRGACSSGRVTGGDVTRDVGVVVRPLDLQRQINRIPGADDHRLQFRFGAGRDVRGGEWQRLDVDLRAAYAESQVFEDGLGRTHWFCPHRNMRLLIGLVEGDFNPVDLTSCYRTLKSSSSRRPSIDTTSAGMAWSLGYSDGEQVSARELVEACARI